PSKPLALRVAAPRAAPSAVGRPQPLGAGLARFFDGNGLSRVAGRAALVDGGDQPQTAVEEAARAGASAVLVYGGELPSGSLRLDEAAPIPVVDVPDATARTILDALGRRAGVGVAIGRPRSSPNPLRGQVAGFSSTG